MDACHDEVIWLQRLPTWVNREYPRGWCHAYMHSEGKVAALVVSRKPRATVAKLERRMGGPVELLQYGDREIIVACPAVQIKRFLRAVGAQKRMEKSEAVKKAEAERLARWKEKKATGEDLENVQTGPQTVRAEGRVE